MASASTASWSRGVSAAPLFATLVMAGAPPRFGTSGCSRQPATAILLRVADTEEALACASARCRSTQGMALGAESQTPIALAGRAESGPDGVKPACCLCTARWRRLLPSGSSAGRAGDTPGAIA